MLALGLDPSLRSYGCAVVEYHPSKSISKRIFSSHSGTLSNVVLPVRFLHVQSMVSDLLHRYPDVEVVGIESPAFDAGPFAFLHYGLILFSMVSIFEARKDLVLFDPATVKSLIYPGKKTAEVNKLDMQRFVQQDTMELKQINNDEADAYCIARSACRMKMLKLGILSPEDLNPGELKKFVTNTKKTKGKLGRHVKKSAQIFRENKLFYDFSKVPAGSVNLPEKSAIPKVILDYLENLEQSNNTKKMKR